MPKFAANLTMLFTELPFMERFQAARAAGFEAVEYLFPYAFDKHELAAALAANGLQQVLHNLPAGNWDAGERGIACHPARQAEFRDGVARAIDYATALSCPRVNCLAGKLPDGVGPDAARAMRKAERENIPATIVCAGIPVYRHGELLVERVDWCDERSA